MLIRVLYRTKVFEGSEMIRVATLPGMWDRTITIGSAGKTFSVTGWKLGWAIGPEQLIRNCQVVHQNCVYACPTPTQEAVARCGIDSQHFIVSHECIHISPKRTGKKNQKGAFGPPTDLTNTRFQGL